MEQKTIPYSYRLYNKILNKSYYGIQYRKGCNPNNLWKTYFSSSRIVKKLIEEYGKESFEFEIRKIFKTKEDTLNWENKVLKRLRVETNDNWLNIKITGEKYCSPEQLDEYWKENIKKGMNNPETKRKISENSKKQFSNPIMRENFRQARLGNKNPAYGKIWINKEGKHKRIYPSDLKQFELDGWIKGRIMLQDINGFWCKPNQITQPLNKDPKTNRYLKRNTSINYGEKE